MYLQVFIESNYLIYFFWASISSKFTLSFAGTWRPFFLLVFYGGFFGLLFSQYFLGSIWLDTSYLSGENFFPQPSNPLTYSFPLTGIIVWFVILFLYYYWYHYMICDDVTLVINEQHVTYLFIITNSFVVL